MARQLGLATLGLLSIAALSGCSGTAGETTAGSSGIQASSLSAQQCAPGNPYIADAAETTSSGTLTIEKTWIRAYVNEAYLWYDQVPTDVDAASPEFSGSMSTLDAIGVPLPLSNYFEALKTKSLTSSQVLLDQFSFTYPTKAWNELFQSSITAGYGIEWVHLSSTAPRSWRIAIVQPGSPAAFAGLRRGDSLLTVDGVDFVNTNAATEVDTLNNGLFPTGGSTHTFTFSRTGSPTAITATLVASNSIVIDPVPVTTVIANGSHTVGYLHFTDHIASSEAKLIAAINTFKAQGVTDLVLDLRYNGGGYLFIASELAYMIAGPARVDGKYFEKLQYNDKRAADNATDATPFFDTSCILNADFGCDNEQPLPTLNLSKVYVIAQSDSCSASEAVINGLRGIDVEVVLVGGTTCGKPYGFTAKDNCGVSYFPIEFKGENYKGFGDYPDGFTPVTANPDNTRVLGCPTGDDFDHSLGNASEWMLATALKHMADGTCLPPIQTAITPAIRTMGRANAVSPTGLKQLPPIRQGRILLPGAHRR